MTAALALSFAVSLAVVAIARRGDLARRLADHPNERSLHTTPTPRVGGLGVMAGALVALAAAGSGDTRTLGACALGLALVSLVDDARGLPALTRLAAHLSAAVVAVLACGGSSGPLVAALAVVALAGMANVFNFMDGTDGMAGGMAVAGFGALAIAAHRAGAPDIALAAGALASASLAFLAFNAPPAKVFLGDCGSIPLGFLAAGLGWLGWERGLWPAWFAPLVFAPFLVDTTVTLARRLAAGERVWLAHRTHYYQRLVTGGWSHRRLAFAAWTWMLLLAACALVAREAEPMLQRGIIGAWSILHLAALVAIDRRHPRRPLPATTKAP